VTVTKVSVPGTDLTFWDSNPFIAKQNIIESVHAWVFGAVALIEVALELVSEIGDWPKEKRLKSTGFYIWIASATIVTFLLLFYPLKNSSNWLARRYWGNPKSWLRCRKHTRPRVSSSSMTAGSLTRSGKGILSNTDLSPYANFESARGTLSQSERLLQMPPGIEDLAQRVARLDRYFKR
jgi:hypothetical protein